MKCPGFEELIDSLDNRLDDAESRRVAAHLAAGCPACSETRDWYAQVRETTAGDDSVAPPSWVFKRAVRIFGTERRTSIGVGFGQLIASLIFDSFARPAIVGVRSTETANRQLLYRAGDYSIDLQIVPFERTRADLIGQVLKEGDPSFESVAGLKLGVSCPGEEVFLSTATDERGDFKVCGIETGVYELRFELNEGSITLRDLPVSGS